MSEQKRFQKKEPGRAFRVTLQGVTSTKTKANVRVGKRKKLLSVQSNPTEKGGSKKPPGNGRRPKRNPDFRRLHLRTIPGARQTFAKFIKLYDQAQIKSEMLRDYCTSFRVLLLYLQAEQEQDIELRLQEVEQRLGISEPEPPALSVVDERRKAR